MRVFPGFISASSLLPLTQWLGLLRQMGSARCYRESNDGEVGGHAESGKGCSYPGLTISDISSAWHQQETLA